MNIAIILAAGRSKRTKGVNKLLFRVRGKPLIFYTIRAFEKHRQIDKIILVAKKNENFSGLVKKYKFKRVAGVIAGGKERQDSAWAGLKMAKKIGGKSKDLLLFHNAANPLVDKRDITAAIKAAKKHGAAVVGQMAKDTVKKTSERGFVAKTLDRKKIFLAQTPQVIEYGLAQKSFARAQKQGYKGTDDASLVERLGKPIKIVISSSKNVKITTREDLKTLSTLLS